VIHRERLWCLNTEGFLVLWFKNWHNYGVIKQLSHVMSWNFWSGQSTLSWHRTFYDTFPWLWLVSGAVPWRDLTDNNII
jgi:hypothetical protein